MIESMETAGEFIKHIGRERLAKFRAIRAHRAWGRAFSSGTQAMIIEGYCNPGETWHENPGIGRVNRASWIPVPESRRGQRLQLIGGCDTVVFKESRHAEKMFRIAEFLNTKTACDIIYNSRGWLPSLLPYLRTVDASRYPGLAFYLKTLDEATTVSTPQPCPITWYVARQWGLLRGRYHRGEITARAAAAELQRSCNLELERIRQGQ